MPHLEPSRTLLPNGLTVICVPMPGMHTTALTLHVRVGSRFESRELNGVSHFLEHMLFRGTPTLRSAHHQALALERLGGTLYAATHTDFGILSLTLPPDNFEEALAVFAEVAKHPIFTDIEVERAIIREEILESLDEDGHQIDPDNLSRAAIYGDHPLGFPITGSLQSLNRLDQQHLRSHHALHYTGRNCVLTVAGPVDPHACNAAVAKHFADLPAGERVGASPASRTQKQARFKYVENSMSQTDLRLAFRAPGEHDPDEPAAEVLVRLLDDGMSTRLYARVCDELGLCYDVSADFETLEGDGVLDLAATVQHERAPVVMKELCGVVSALAREGPSDDELTKAKARHGWEMQSILDDPTGIAEFHGLAALARISGTPEARHAEIQEVTGAQVQEVARKIFRPENVCGIAVGVLEDRIRREVEQLVRGFSVR